MSEFLMENAPTIATIFFFLMFCYIVYAVFKKGATKKFDKYSQIPLQENDRENGGENDRK